MGEPLLFLLVAGAGVAVGRARGGTLRGLRETGVKGRPLALACLAVQATVVVLPLRAIGLPLGLGTLLLLGALVTLLGLARANGRLAGVPLLALGLLLNLIVVVANLGMPVPSATMERAGISVERSPADRPDAKHVLERDGTRLGLLGDRLAVRPLRAVTGMPTLARTTIRLSSRPRASSGTPARAPLALAIPSRVARAAASSTNPPMPGIGRTTTDACTARQPRASHLALTPGSASPSSAPPLARPTATPAPATSRNSSGSPMDEGYSTMPCLRATATARVRSDTPSLVKIRSR